MKRFVCLISFISVVLFLLNTCSYANTNFNWRTDKKNSIFYTEEERKKIILSDNYKVIINNIDIGKSIEVNEYNPSEGTFISLREFVQILDGNIEWRPDYDTNYLGSFQVSYYKYNFYSQFKLNSYEDKELYFPITITLEETDKDIIIPMNPWSESVNAKYVNDKIYIPITSVRAILPRMGCLFNINKNNKLISIKDYDFEQEKDLLLKKYPPEKFDGGMYDNKYEDIVLDTTGLYYFQDFFTYQNNTTLNIENNYFDYIDCNYQRCYEIDKNDSVFLKNILQAAYMMWINEEIITNYDKELDAYVIYNKDFQNIEKLDDSYKILIVRKYDNMILYKY